VLPGAAPVDGATHLRDYKIKETKKSCDGGASYAPCAADSDCPGGTCAKTPKHEKQPLLAVQNALGITVVSTKKVVGLMAATATSGAGPVDSPGVTNVDTYKCYGVKLVKKVCVRDPATACKSTTDCGLGGIDGPCLTRFPKALAKLLDDVYTVGDKAFQLKAPKRLCLATAIDGVAPQHPGAHFLCYGAKPLKKACDETTAIPGRKCRDEEDCAIYFNPAGECALQPKTVVAPGLYAANLLGRERVDPKREKEVCFPSLLL